MYSTRMKRGFGFVYYQKKSGVEKRPSASATSHKNKNFESTERSPYGGFRHCESKNFRHLRCYTKYWGITIFDNVIQSFSTKKKQWKPCNERANFSKVSEHDISNIWYPFNHVTRAKMHTLTLSQTLYTSCMPFEGQVSIVHSLH